MLSAQLLPALRTTFVTLVLTGLAYPFAVTGLAQLAFPGRASGSLLHEGTQPVGSELLAQKFSAPAYFQPRPSAAGDAGYDASSSGGSSSWNIFKPQPSTGPSTWQKFSTASKNNWTKVKDAVNPFDKPTSVPPTVKAPDSSYSWGSTTQQKNTNKSSGGMWPWSKPAESKPQTVNDFLSQKRPE